MFAVVDNPTTLDERALSGMRSFPGGERILESAIRAYLRESTEAWDALRNACAAGDRYTVQRLTHNLKSSSAMLGATRLASLYQGLEQEAGSSPAADLTQRLETIRGEYGHVERAPRAPGPQPPTGAPPATSHRARPGPLGAGPSTTPRTP